jgi:hypothetical protein
MNSDCEELRSDELLVMDLFVYLERHASTIWLIVSASDMVIFHSG